MTNNFWNKLSKPFFVMAPMEDVTDIAFRQMFAKHSELRGPAPYRWTRTHLVTFTEFVSADGLALAPEEGREKILSKLQFEENERPIVAQIFGADPKNMEKATKMVAELGFDGIDINMGCPDKSVEKQGAGASLIKNPILARKIIRTAKKERLAVSVKTRIGYYKNEIRAWIPELLKEHPDALTVHLRTRKEMSDAPAHWELMSDILELRDKISHETLIIGNGDVESLEDAKQKARKYGCDGVMIGRALFGNPKFFSPNHNDCNDCNPITIREKLEMLVEHVELFDKYLLVPGFKGYHVMKKHFKAYVSGWDGAKKLRIKLMNTSTPEEAKKILKEYLV